MKTVLPHKLHFLASVTVGLNSIGGTKFWKYAMKDPNQKFLYTTFYINSQSKGKQYKILMQSTLF